MNRATVTAILSLMLNFFAIGAISTGISLPDWFIPFLLGVAAVHFGERLINPEPTSFNIRPLVVRSVIVFSVVLSVIGWLVMGIAIPDYWIAYFGATVGFYIPSARRELQGQ